MRLKCIKPVGDVRKLAEYRGRLVSANNPKVLHRDLEGDSLKSDQLPQRHREDNGQLPMERTVIPTLQLHAQTNLKNNNKSTVDNRVRS